MRAAAFVLGCGVLSANIKYYWEQLFNLDQYVKNYQLKQGDSPVTIPQSIQDLVTSVLKDIKIYEKTQSLVKPFALNDIRPKYFGFLGHKPGIYFGIPANFLYEFDEINFEKLPFKIDLKTLDASDLSKLKANLSLSEKAKKFAIAQEVFQSTHLSFYGRSFLSFVCLSLCYAALHHAGKRNLQKINKYKPLFIFHMTIVFLFFYATVYNILNEHQSGYADISAAKLGKEYIEGGLEYLEKLLTVNEIIDKVESPFNKFDREVYDCTVTSFSLNRRISFLKKLSTVGADNVSVWRYLVHLRQFIPSQEEKTN